MGMVFDSDGEVAAEARRETFVLYDNESQIELLYEELPRVRALLDKLERYCEIAAQRLSQEVLPL